MPNRGMDFKHKEVINIKDGKRMGYVQDVCADLETGSITARIVPGDKKIFGIFNTGDDIVIEWNKIKCIGEDVILIEM